MLCRSLVLGILTCFSALSNIEDHYKQIDFKGASRGPKGIDFVYMINLDNRPERWKEATGLLAPYGIYPQRFSAIYGWTLQPDLLNDISLTYAPGMKIDQEYVMHFPINGGGEPVFIWLGPADYGKGVFSQWTVKGTIGCSLSHFSVLKDAYDSGYETVWILEDDIAIIDNPHKLTDRIQELDDLLGKDGWDVLYTDYDYLVVDTSRDLTPQIPMMWRPDMPNRDIRFLAEHKDISDELMQVGSRMRAHSMVYRRCGIEKILNFYREHGNFLPYDQELALIPGIRTFVVKNNIVSVFERTTDTRNRYFSE